MITKSANRCDADSVGSAFSGCTVRRMWGPDEIKRRRFAAGMTQGQLADRVGVARRTIVDWEGGRTTPQGRFHARLAAALTPKPEPEPVESVESAGPLLREATFAEAMRRLVELHRQVAGGMGAGFSQVDNGVSP